jgi:hypothetical protein
VVAVKTGEQDNVTDLKFQTDHDKSSDLVIDVCLLRTGKCIMSHWGIKMMIAGAKGLPRVLHKIALSIA